MTEWLSLSTHPLYEVSKEGQVRNAATGKILAGGTDRDGYSFVLVSQGGERKNLKVHRLVALVWLPSESQKTYVQHVDGNRKNNSASNLRWVTAREKNTRRKPR